MPASQKTPNYQLPIYAEEDVTSYLQDFNPAMQKIDTQMKANADAAAAAQSDADSLDTRVTALEDAPAGVTELDSDTDVTGFENGYILVNNNGKLGAIEPSGGTGTDPNAIHASGGGTFSASEGIGSTGPYNIVVDEEPAGVPITSDDVTVPESASAFAGKTVTKALRSLKNSSNIDYSLMVETHKIANNVKAALDYFANANIEIGSFYAGIRGWGTPFLVPLNSNPYAGSKTYLWLTMYYQYGYGSPSILRNYALNGIKWYKEGAAPKVSIVIAKPDDLSEVSSVNITNETGNVISPSPNFDGGMYLVGLKFEPEGSE